MPATIDCERFRKLRKEPADRSESVLGTHPRHLIGAGAISRGSVRILRGSRQIGRTTPGSGGIRGWRPRPAEQSKSMRLAFSPASLICRRGGRSSAFSHDPRVIPPEKDYGRGHSARSSSSSMLVATLGRLMADRLAAPREA